MVLNVILFLNAKMFEVQKEVSVKVKVKAKAKVIIILAVILAVILVEEVDAEQAVQLYPSAGRLGHFLAHAPTSGPGDSHVFGEDDEVAWAGTPNDWADTVEFQTPDGAAKVPA